MLIPVRTDRRLHRVPWVNFGLIIINIIVFVFTRGQIERASVVLMELGGKLSYDEIVHYAPILKYYLNPTRPEVYQFITSAFLHGDWMHLLGNMLFLYVFGNAVEDRLGRLGYLAFYLAGGVVAGLGHAMDSDVFVLGASGAVSAVTGAFLALFPRSRVLIIFWLFIVGTFEVASLVLILFEIGKNVLYHVIGVAGVAWMAHLAGYGFGFLVGMLLLWTRLLPREPYDMLSVWEHRKRRTSFRRLVKGGESPWEHEAKQEKEKEEPSAPVAPPPGETMELAPRDEETMALRGEISEAMAGHDLSRAAKVYLELVDRDPKQVLSQKAQLDVASQLVAEEKREEAAEAFEKFLRTYPRYSDIEQVQLMLGVLYSRYLDQKARAAELLREAIPKLSDPEQKELARRTLDEVG